MDEGHDMSDVDVNADFGVPVAPEKIDSNSVVSEQVGAIPMAPEQMSSNPMAPTGLSSLPESVGEVQIGVEEKKKPKKGLIIAGIVCILFALLAGFVFLKQSGVVDKILSGGRMSNEELAVKLSQVNYDLKNLTNEYNERFVVGDEGENRSVVVSKRDFDVLEKDYMVVEDELNELPKAENTKLNDESKPSYTKLVKEMWDRFNVAKDGIELSRKFNEAFFWAIINGVSESKNEGFERVGQTDLLENERDDVKELANVLEEYYRLLLSRSNDNVLADYWNAHSDFGKKYFQLFRRVDDPNAFYKEGLVFVGGVRG